ncbi:MAG: efflux RND transporter periplasmic adaptor subunit [Neisseria sp.]|nr:efflux RND transporter periplasmic adaptor subunit [Neisseria sp.]
MSKKRIFGIIALLALVAFAAWYGYRWFSTRAQSLPEHIVSSNARLEMGRSDVATLYAGRVLTVTVREGDTVSKDQELATLEATQIAAQLDIAQAARERARAAVAAQQQKLDVAALDYRNTQNLHRDALVSRSELDKRNAQLKGERAGVDAARAAEAEAEAQIKRIEDMNHDMTVRAPLDGRVEYRLAEPGEVVPAGGRIVSLLDPSDVSLNVFLPTSTMARTHVGAAARIRVDGVDAVFPADVTFIASQAQFTPKYVETQNERDKMTYRVKLTIPSEIALQHQTLLKGGLTATGYVNTSAEADFPPELAVRLPERTAP